MTGSEQSREKDYVEIIMAALEVSRAYRPRFGHGAGVTLAEFQSLYRSDPFYSWFGMDSPLLYAAHRAAGGMTSVYRQIGMGCQRLIQRILMDSLGLTEEQSTWSYRVAKRGGKERILSLDCRIPTEHVRGECARTITPWLQQACEQAGVTRRVRDASQGPLSRLDKVTRARIPNAKTPTLPTLEPRTPRATSQCFSCSRRR